MAARTTSLLLAAAAAFTPFTLVACDSGLTEQGETLVYLASTPDAGTTSLVQQMMNAPSSTLLQGVRRIEAHWNVAGNQQDLVYREQVTCDGQGQFAVDPVEAILPPMGGGQESVFLMLQKEREGFMFTHRDFMVRDLDLFFANYQVTDLGVTTTVAGRTCAQLDVERQRNPESIFHLAVDVQTGMILRAREEGLDGQLISLMEFEDFSDMPDLAGTVFHAPLTANSDLANMTKPLPFVAVRPKLIPQGYQLISSEALENAPGEETWTRFIYSDGLRELFFLYRGESELVAPGGIQPAPPTTQRQDKVMVLEAGPWNVVQGEVFDGEVIVMGIAPVPELLDMIESAFE